MPPSGNCGLINKGVGRPNTNLVDDVLSETTASYLALHAAVYGTAYTSAVANLHPSGNLARMQYLASGDTISFQEMHQISSCYTNP